MVAITDDYGAYGPTDSNQLVLSQDGFDIYYLGTNVNSYGDSEFVFYVYNGTDQYVNISIDALAADGFMQTYGYDSNYADAYEGVLLFAEVNEDVDISSVSSASIKFGAYDMTSYDDILNTGNVSFIQ
jgi:hypothetical protein